MTREPGGSFVATGQTREQPSATVKIDHEVVAAFRSDLSPAMADYVQAEVAPAAQRFLKTSLSVGQQAGIPQAELDAWSMEMQTELALTGVELAMSQSKLPDGNWALLPENFPETGLTKIMHRITSEITSQTSRFHNPDPQSKAIADQVLRDSRQVRTALSDEALFGAVVLPMARKHGLTGPQ